MSNLVHRRRRCARIVPYMILMPRGQYARGWILFLPRIERIERSCPMEERRDQKVCCFPRAYALQPDVYAQPSKRASLSDHPHPSSLPTGRQESIKTK